MLRSYTEALHVLYPRMYIIKPACFLFVYTRGKCSTLGKVYVQVYKMLCVGDMIYTIPGKDIRTCTQGYGYDTLIQQRTRYNEMSRRTW